MGGGKKKIYKKRNPVKVALKVLGIALAVLVILSITVFFGFQKYIVYTPDGIRLEIPFLQRYGPSPSPTADVTEPY